MLEYLKVLAGYLIVVISKFLFKIVLNLKFRKKETKKARERERSISSSGPAISNPFK